MNYLEKESPDLILAEDSSSCDKTKPLVLSKVQILPQVLRMENLHLDPIVRKCSLFSYENMEKLNEKLLLLT